MLGWWAYILANLGGESLPLMDQILKKRGLSQVLELCELLRPEPMVFPPSSLIKLDLIFLLLAASLRHLSHEGDRYGQLLLVDPRDLLSQVLPIDPTEHHVRLERLASLECWAGTSQPPGGFGLGWGRSIEGGKRWQLSQDATSGFLILRDDRTH